MKRRLTRKQLVWIAAGAAAYVSFIMNGSYFVDRFIRPFEFGELEMTAVLGSLNRTAEWRVTASGVGYRVRARFVQQVGTDSVHAAPLAPLPFQNVAHACGSRSFRQSASACYDTTNLPVSTDVTVARELGTGGEVLREWRGISGDLVAYGRTLSRIDLRLTMPDGYLEMHSDDAQSFRVTSLHVENNGTDVVAYDD
jgi:hypothetical protein